MANSVAFLDESGDESGKLAQGASSLYVVGLVVFADAEEAARCREQIDRLRTTLRKPQRFEFHFRDNGHADRLAFLTAVAPFAFTYYAITLEKHEAAGHLPLYLQACARVAALAGDLLDGTLLIVDAGEKHRPVRRGIATALRQRINSGLERIAVAEVRPQESDRNSMIQLADYATGYEVGGNRASPVQRCIGACCGHEKDSFGAARHELPTRNPTA